MANGIMFHHFHNSFHPKSQGSLSSKNFEQVLNYLETHFNILGAEKFAEKLESKKLLKKDICLTFDDALMSQFDVARPSLNRMRIKAFFFIYSSIFSSELSPLEFFRDFRHTNFNSVSDFYTLFFSVFEKEYPELKKNFVCQKIIFLVSPFTLKRIRF